MSKDDPENLLGRLLSNDPALEAALKAIDEEAKQRPLDPRFVRQVMTNLLLKELPGITRYAPQVPLEVDPIGGAEAIREANERAAKYLEDNVPRLASDERSVAIKRGLTAAQAKGTKLGRPCSTWTDPEKLREARRRLTRGDPKRDSYRAIARDLNVDFSAVARLARSLGIVRRKQGTTATPRPLGPQPNAPEETTR